MRPLHLLFAFVLLALCARAQPGDPFPNRYTEPAEASRPNRQREFDQIGAYVEALQDAAPGNRDASFKPDFSSTENFYVSTIPLRETVCKSIGFPPPKIKRLAKPRWEHVADDAYASISRLWVEVLEGVDAYGIISIPHNMKGAAPLVICQHGGGGNPELVHGMLEGVGTGNYGWMTLRALQQGYVTLEPALVFPYGGTEKIDGPTRQQLDRQLQNLGTSILAVELWKIFRLIDVVRTLPEVDRDRIAMLGLSYGGLYTLYATALDTRINVAVSSCFFNERRRYAWQDWSFFDFMNTFNDAEICALICPRPFMVEAGDADPLFAVDGAKSEAMRARRYWEGLGLSGRFVLDVFSGTHEFKGDRAYDFMKQYLRKADE